MRLGAGKRFVEADWKRRWAYALLGEPHVPGWIRLQHVIRQVQGLGFNGQPLRFLDAGCSRGDLSLYLAERHPSWSFLGVELEPERVAMAEKIRRETGLVNVRYQVADLCALPYENEFDLAVCSDVLEHIPDDRAAFASLVRALTPGGYLIVTTPSTPQPKHLWTVAWREKKTGFDPSEYGHVREGYSLDALHAAFVAGGADPVKLRYTYGPWGTLAFDLFFSIGDSKPNPLLFTGLYPLLKTFAWIDVHQEPGQGAAVLGIARKPGGSTDEKREG